MTKSSDLKIWVSNVPAAAWFSEQFVALPPAGRTVHTDPKIPKTIASTAIASLRVL